MAFLRPYSGLQPSKTVTQEHGNGWETKADMPTGRMGLSVVAANNKIYAMGGYFYDKNEEYDPATNTWSTKAALYSVLVYHAAAAYNDKIYIAGGVNAPSVIAIVVKEYNPATNTWSNKANMLVARDGLTLASPGNGKLYAIGGEGSGFVAGTGRNDEYNISGDSWANKTSAPTARRYITSATYNGKVYVLAGANNDTPVVKNEEYDPVTDTWATKADSPIGAGGGFSACELFGRIFLMGSDKNFEYKAETNTWVARQAPPTSRTYGGIAPANGKMHFIGGGSSSAKNELYTPSFIRSVNVPYKPKRGETITQFNYF